MSHHYSTDLCNGLGPILSGRLVLSATFTWGAIGEQYSSTPPNIFLLHCYNLRKKKRTQNFYKCKLLVNPYSVSCEPRLGVGYFHYHPEIQSVILEVLCVPDRIMAQLRVRDEVRKPLSFPLIQG